MRHLSDLFLEGQASPEQVPDSFFAKRSERHQSKLHPQPIVDQVDLLFRRVGISHNIKYVAC
jgi:hypothetical protein